MVGAVFCFVSVWVVLVVFLVVVWAEAAVTIINRAAKIENNFFINISLVDRPV